MGGADGMEHTPGKNIQEEVHIQEEDVHILDKTPIRRYRMISSMLMIPGRHVLRRSKGILRRITRRIVSGTRKSHIRCWRVCSFTVPLVHIKDFLIAFDSWCQQ